MAVPTFTEDELGRRWDKCIADAFIKLAGGVVIGGISSLVLFKRRKWPVILGTGFGIGLAYGHCERDIGAVLSLSKQPADLGGWSGGSDQQLPTLERSVSSCVGPVVVMSGQPRSYLDPWDIENYIYLRTGPVRRRSVCFDTAVRYASYDESSEPGTSCSVGDLKSYGWTYSSLPLHCPSCVSSPAHNRDYERIAYEEPVYEDVTRMGVNTFGHLRIDYSNNWNKLDRYIGRA